MKKIIIYIVLVTMLMVGSFFAGAVNINTKQEPLFYAASNFDENDADLPEWNDGDIWTYNIEISLEQNEYFDMDFDLKIDNLKFEVLGDVEENNNMYNLSMTVPWGDLTGGGSVDLSIFTFTGDILNSLMNGYMHVKKSTLEINKCEGNINGDTNKLLLPHFDLDFLLQFEAIGDIGLVKTNFSTLKFPMNVDESWSVPFTYVNLSVNATLPNLGARRLYTYIPDHEEKCIQWDVITIDNTDYDALKISGVDYGSKSDIWYSPALGNVVKLDYRNVELGLGYIFRKFTIDLVSTNYQVVSNPPEIPSIPDGPTDIIFGDTVNYETSTTDPDGNKIRYIFDWDDGAEKTYTDFVNSGETVEVSHKWITEGSHDIRVKARDKFGWESDWSDTLTVTVSENNAPDKPSKPDGLPAGKIKKPYDYSTSATDPDGHQVRYGWDWDGNMVVDEWTDLHDSGEEVNTSHTWYTKGNYNIRVKAKDEYGKEGNWSDPFPVGMPKSKAIYLQFIQLFELFKEKFPRMFYILEIIIRR
jgi:YD repeat-containing protein